MKVKNYEGHKKCAVRVVDLNNPNSVIICTKSIVGHCVACGRPVCLEHLGYSTVSGFGRKLLDRVPVCSSRDCK